MQTRGLKTLAIGVALALPVAFPSLALAATGDPEILLPSIPAQSDGTMFSRQVATLVTGGEPADPSDWAISINWGDGTGTDTTSATVSPAAGVDSSGCEAIPQGATWIPNGGLCGEANNNRDPVYTVSVSGHTFQGPGRTGSR